MSGRAWADCASDEEYESPLGDFAGSGYERFTYDSEEEDTERQDKLEAPSSSKKGLFSFLPGSGSSTAPAVQKISTSASSAAASSQPEELDLSLDSSRQGLNLLIKQQMVTEEKKEEDENHGEKRGHSKSATASSVRASKVPRLEGDADTSSSKAHTVAATEKERQAGEEAEKEEEKEKEEEEEVKQRRIEQRQKQIDIGKATDGYKNYVRIVPKERRVIGVHPITPNVHQSCSKRSWDGQVRAWRRALHDYDELHAGSAKLAEWEREFGHVMTPVKALVKDEDQAQVGEATPPARTAVPVRLNFDSAAEFPPLSLAK